MSRKPDRDEGADAPPPFGFGPAGAIRLGCGVAGELGERAARLGGRALVVTGSAPERHAAILATLDRAGVERHAFRTSGEPDVETAERGAALAREIGADLVVAIGGGAALDAGKAVAALATNTGGALRHLEVVGGGLPLDRPPLPLIALPTTAGTGAEATRNAVLTVPEHRRKVSLRDPAMVPRLALIDPALAVGAPPMVTLASGLDALTQCIEPFVARGANPLTDALVRDAIARAIRALPRLLDDPGELVARHDMAVAALAGGLALASAGLGAVHGLAGPLGGLTGAPHGALCGRLLPPVLRLNARVAVVRGDERTGERLGEVAHLIVGEPDVGRAAEHLEALMERGGLPTLSAWVSDADMKAAAEAAASSSSMRANPVPLAPPDLEAAMREAF